ncbi:uracil-xanthine permease family protein [Desulfogranum mediterraneum]|uniref:uracil-xanthine permease family protein n=1 Tax=Desulfogranum mediterraneum TaxID=160661 RepID=UPI00042366FC|nr:nucleobase:cation symporter-2 family protein [Desulfogranum mediterraneum]
MSRDPNRFQDPDYLPPLHQAVPLGIQHILAMFASNVTPAIIISSAAGFAFGSLEMVYMIQMVMVFAGISTLLQTIGLGPVGARLPVVQGTSFAFIPVMIPIVKTAGMAALFGGVVIGGIFHFFLGTIIGRLRNLLPPLVTGTVVLTIGLTLLPVGIKYAAGGVPLMGTPGFGSLEHWGLALLVIFLTLGLKFFTRGILATAAILIALVIGYLVAIPMGMVSFATVQSAAWFAMPQPLHFGFEFNLAAVIGMGLMSFVSAIETVGDISGITKGGAGREATNREIAGGTLADGLGSALSGLFGGLPNTSFSQNVGLISMTGVMSRHVVTLGAIFLLIAGLVPKVGAVIAAMPISVLGGGVIVMFGMVVSAGITMLSEVKWNRRNMVILAVSLSIGIGLQAVPQALQHVPGTMKILLTSGILPASILAIGLNYLLPHDLPN